MLSYQVIGKNLEKAKRMCMFRKIRHKNAETKDIKVFEVPKHSDIDKANSLIKLAKGKILEIKGLINA